MKFERLVLHNIRSYTSVDITFPAGVVLLSGDIGSGKSTILLALEFALFGFTKGEVSGDLLLRHGCNKGEVALSLQIGTHDVYIVRTLKRTETSVVQDSGSLRVDGVITSLTPTELKARILSLLEYPPDLITKKSLIYRYTVYTPQEQMKWILLGDPSLRLDTLRRVFAIDKYQQVAENIKIVVRHFRDIRKELDGRLHDVPELLAERYTLATSLTTFEKDLKQRQEEQQEILLSLTTQRRVVAELEDALSSQQKLHQEMIGLQERTSSLSVQHQQLGTMLQKAISRKEELFTAQQEIPPLEALRDSMSEIRAKISHAQQEIQTIHSQEQQQEFVVRQAQEVRSRVGSLSVCPVCEQQVGDTHKQMIFSREDTKISQATLLRTRAQETLITYQQQLHSFEEQLSQLQIQERQAHVLFSQRDELQRVVASVQEYMQRQEEITAQLVTARQRQEMITQQLACFVDLRERCSLAKQQLEKITLLEKENLVALARLEKSVEDVLSRTASVQDAIAEKEKIQIRRMRVLNLTSWCTTYLLPLLVQLEQKVMCRLRVDFEKLFVQWFSLLMGSEEIHVSLDAEFSPCVLQHGHTTSYAHLSGGEKTALALAYRLALNQVITTLTKGLMTHGVIILDEPTDGFSSSQIDRLRLVLDELSLQQVLLVSHEPKIASFCDTVIYLEKNGQESVVKR